MNQVLGTFKQIGATIIILVIIVMMGITFSSQPRHEILALLAGEDRIGQFQGKEIRPETYRFVAESCKNRYRMYGNVPDVFIQQCISRDLKQVVVLPVVAVDSGLDISEKSVQDVLFAQVRQQQLEQAQSHLEEDRLSAEQIYRHLVAMEPLDLRVRMGRIEQFQIYFTRPFPVPAAEARALERAASSRLELEVVAFTNTEVMSRFTAEANEDEMRAVYEKDKKEAEAQAKKEGVNRPYPAFAERRDFLKERVIVEKKKKQLEELKTSLGAIKGDAALEKVAETVHGKPERVQVRLGALEAVSLPSGRRVNLTGGHFFADLITKEGLKGPYQDGETTVYLRVLKFESAPAGPDRVEKPQGAEERGMMLTSALLTNMVDEYAKTGKFKLKNSVAQNGEN